MYHHITIKEAYVTVICCLIIKYRPLSEYEISQFKPDNNLRGWCYFLDCRV